MKERVKRIKRVTIRILTNGQPSGTGFVVSGAVLIGTCFHVIQHVQAALNWPAWRGDKKGLAGLCPGISLSLGPATLFEWIKPPCDLG